MERIDEWIDAGLIVDMIWELMTDTECAVCVLIMDGYSFTEINEHFEWTYNRVHVLMKKLRDKMRLQLPRIVLEELGVELEPLPVLPLFSYMSTRMEESCQG